MNGKYLRKESWEKQQFFLLDNGHKAILEYSVHYGEYVKGLIAPDGKSWYGCNGLRDLPEFALPWIEELRNQHGVFERLVRPNFNKGFH